ncbi:MAG: class I SAM-dependent methyltransferase [Actinomycetota bacterium]
MEFADVARMVEGVPNMSPAQGRRIYDFILEHRMTDVLELGTAHGTSACYMAAALHQVGRGRVLTIDRPDSLQRDPNIFELLDRTGLKPFVEVVTSPSSYDWELMKIIKRRSRLERSEPLFDFCYLDGAHTWQTDGLAFFLVEKLLRRGGWILFDDLDWTFHRSSTLRETDWVLALPEEERTAPQMKRVFEFLVRQHVGFDSFQIDEEWGWGWARNARNTTMRPLPPKVALRRFAGGILRRLGLRRPKAQA